MIKQQKAFDCAICAIAMLTGWDYDTVVRDIGDYYDPEMGCFTSPRMFARLGYEIETTCRRPPAGREALIAFRVKEGYRHMVYWDGYGIKDPANYPKTYAIDDIAEIYILRNVTPIDAKLRLGWLNKSQVAHAGVRESCIAPQV